MKPDFYGLASNNTDRQTDRHTTRPRKTSRALQACEFCRGRKQKCEGGENPPCNNCLYSKRICSFTAATPIKKGRTEPTLKQSTKMPRRIKHYETVTSRDKKRVQTFETTINNVLEEWLKRIQNETTIRSAPQPLTCIAPHQSGPRSVSKPSLTTLALETHGTWSPISRFTKAIDDLGLSVPSELHRDWIAFTYNERLEHHAQTCKLDQPDHIFKCRRDLQVLSGYVLRTLYGTAGYSEYRTSNVEDIVNRAEHHIARLHRWRQLLPPALSWKNEDIPALNLYIGHVCSDYSRACSMALLPYLHIASKRSVLPQTTEIADLDASQRRLIDIASQCIVSAFQCAEMSAVLYASLETACRGCRDSRDHAIHERFEIVVILVAIYRSELRHLLPINTPLTKQNLTVLLAQTVAEASASNLNLALQMDAEILRAVQTRFGLCFESGTFSRAALNRI